MARMPGWHSASWTRLSCGRAANPRVRSGPVPLHVPAFRRNSDAAAPALIILFFERRTFAAALGAAVFYVAAWQNIPVDNGAELTYGPWEIFVS